MVISNYFSDGYLKLNYHRLLIIIGGTILLLAIGGYFISGYWWLS
jgi:hypothetical protein